MLKQLSEYMIGDMIVRYLINEKGNVGLEIFPASLKGQVTSNKKYNVDSLVQAYIRGDDFPGAYSNGHTMRNSQSTSELVYDSQSKVNNENTLCVKTVLKNAHKHVVNHVLTYQEGLKAFEVKTIYSNQSDTPVHLEMLSSFSLGGLTPFIQGEAPESMRIHRMRSCWSDEGRLITDTVENLQLEPSWAHHGVRSEKFGQIGSMPVRKYFPFAAVEDHQTGVTWAVQLACASSWQIELYRKDDALCLSGGLADYDFGHWMKTLQPGEAIETPDAYITVGVGSVNEVTQRLLTIHKDNFKKINKQSRLPVLFNEFCTTWGVPSHDNIQKIIDTIKDRGINYFVIDAGWYADKVKGWERTNGDWAVSQELFPYGLKKTVELIQKAGMIPGIWFEFEICGPLAEALVHKGHLLKRNGTLLRSGERYFWDMADPWVIDYLGEKVITMLKTYGFKYIKVDYNETIGVGCDGYESLGEGVRQRILATQAFLKKIRDEIPDIVIENCSSGGHRLEPSMMALCDMASFSDAHECPEIPIVAANLHRVILPCQSQIWAVLRKTDSIKRIVYSIVNTFLGVMCLSGDVYDLSAEQWAFIDEGIRFYRAVSGIIMDGTTSYYGPQLESHRDLKGWQGIVRESTDEKEILVILHSFQGDFPADITIPVDGKYQINQVYSAFNNQVSLGNGRLLIKVKEAMEGIAIHLKA